MASGVSQSKWRELKSKFVEKFLNEDSTSPRQLVCHFDNLFIAWSHRHQCLFAADVNNSADHCYKLTLSHKLSFRVEHVQSSPSGNILLWSQGGVCVVILPDNINFAQNNELECRCVPIGEILLLQTPGLEILSAKWFPTSPTDVAVLMSDNCLRIFDINSKLSQPTLSIQVLRRSISLSRTSFSIATATGDQIIDFDFGAPSEIFCLATCGSIYRISNISLSQSCKPRVSNALRLLPDSDDHYGCDGYSLLCLTNQTMTVIVLSGTAGSLYHCLVLNQNENEPDEDPELFVVEKVTLSLTLTESLNDYRCPIILKKDESVSNRYFCIHGSGLHVVVIPFTELLEKYAVEDASNDASFVMDSPSGQCLVEQVVCTRTNENSPDDYLVGACVVPSYPSPLLMVFTSQLKLIDVPLTRYRISGKQNCQDLLSEAPLRSSEILGEKMATDFEREIKTILAGSRVPVMAQADKVTDPKALLELTLQTTQLFRDRYLLKMSAVSKLIDSKSRSLRQAKADQLKETQQLQQELLEAQRRSKALNEKLQSTQATSLRQNRLLHDIIQCVQRKHPSKANPEIVKELRSLTDRSNRLESVLETTRQRLDDLRDLQDGDGDKAVQKDGGKLTESQIQFMKERLKTNSSDITEMVKGVKDLLTEI